jgi:hypothetical protein
MVAKDHLPNAEAGDQTATLSGPTASRSCGAARSCVTPVAAVIEAIIVVPSQTCADLYALLQCGEDSEYRCKAYSGYIEVFWPLLAEDGESSPPASENFQSTNA